MGENVKIVLVGDRGAGKYSWYQSAVNNAAPPFESREETLKTYFNFEKKGTVEVFISTRKLLLCWFWFWFDSNGSIPFFFFCGSFVLLERVCVFALKYIHHDHFFQPTPNKQNKDTNSTPRLIS